MLRGLKKTIAVCLIGFGVGTIMVLLLPASWWLDYWNYYDFSGNYVVILLEYFIEKRFEMYEGCC